MKNILKLLSYLIPDKLYLKIKYKIKLKRPLNLIEPRTFNEKLQWLKLYDRKDIYTTMVDKYEVKQYVASTIGEKYIIPTLGIYDSFDMINFENLPSQFVIKCTHDSGGLVICDDKENLHISSARKKINKSMKKNYFYSSREWPYKNVKPRIIIEQYMKDRNSSDLKDYKIFCFNGKPEIILVCSNRSGSYKNTDFYGTDWNLLPFTRANHTNNPQGINRPKKLEEMLEISKKLSQNIPFVRVDLYEINKQIYFGELTFFPSAGFEGFSPEEWDIKLGELIDLDRGENNEK